MALALVDPSGLVFRDLSFYHLLPGGRAIVRSFRLDFKELASEWP
jgi:hypothetical protein